MGTIDVTQIINQILKLFIMLGIGFICNKTEIITENIHKNITKLLLYVTMPCLILSSVMGDNFGLEKEEVLFTIAIAVALYIIYPVFGVLINMILRVPKEDWGLYLYMTEFSNVGFMGYPVVSALFGNEAILLCSIFNMIYGVFQYSLGIYLINIGKEEKAKINFKEMLNPGMFSGVLAIIIYFVGMKFPYFISGTLSDVGQITTPMAMFLIGASLGSMKAAEIFGEFRLYPYTIIKQIIMPIFSALLLKNIISNPLILGVTAVIIAMPVGTTSIMFANLYDANDKLAAKSIFITTLCSFVTIPILCMIL